jgi:transposase
VGVGLNEIARRVGVAPSTVRLTLKRLASAGLSWPLPAEMSDSALETALFAERNRSEEQQASQSNHRVRPTL